MSDTDRMSMMSDTFRMCVCVWRASRLASRSELLWPELVTSTMSEPTQKYPTVRESTLGLEPCQTLTYALLSPGPDAGRGA
eukprot:708091-Rhodomonas_salina.2